MLLQFGTSVSPSGSAALADLGQLPGKEGRDDQQHDRSGQQNRHDHATDRIGVLESLVVFPEIKIEHRGIAERVQEHVGFHHGHSFDMCRRDLKNQTLRIGKGCAVLVGFPAVPGFENIFFERLFRLRIGREHDVQEKRESQGKRETADKKGDQSRADARCAIGSRGIRFFVVGQGRQFFDLEESRRRLRGSASRATNFLSGLRRFQRNGFAAGTCETVERCQNILSISNLW